MNFFKNSKWNCFFGIFVSLFIIFGSVDIGYAKGGGGGSRGGGSRSFSRSSSSSKSTFNRSGGGFFGKKDSAPAPAPKQSQSSSGYSKPKPAAPAPSAKQSQPSSSGYTKPQQKAPSGIKKANLAGSTFDQKAVAQMKRQKSAASLERYKSEQQKFKTPPKSEASTANFSSNPVYSKAKNYGSHDNNTYYDRRDSYYQSRNWTPQTYVYQSSPSFGMWDCMFWWMILDNMNDKNQYAAAYHHSDDPGYQEWRKEAEKLSETNADLKAKLEALDKNVSSLNGTAKDTAYLPAGVSAEVVLANDVLSSKPYEKPKLRIATGADTGTYYQYGQFIKESFSSGDVEVLTTAGSMENLRKLLNREVDAALVQSDVIALLGNEFPGQKLVSEQSTVYREAIQVLANNDSGIWSITDLTNDNIIYVGPSGSGTEKTWQGLSLQDNFYSGIPTKNSSYEEALVQVKTNENAVMIIVSGLNNKLLKTETDVRLVNVDDWDFNDKTDENGNVIYEFVDIGPTVYPDLQKGWIWGHRDVTTLAVQAVFVLRSDWAEKYGPDAVDALSFAILEVSPKVNQLVNGL